MKEKYVEPIMQMIFFQKEDIITTSPGQGDNTLDDGFFN